MYKELLQTDHRPFPLPNKPWVMTQVLQDVFFMHWPVEATILSKLLPTDLILDLYEGMAWVSIVPFRVVGMRMRGLPPIPWLNTYLQMNVRTYVTKNGIPAIYFLKIHTNHLPVVFGARILTGLPYVKKTIKYKKKMINIPF